MTTPVASSTPKTTTSMPPAKTAKLDGSEGHYQWGWGKEWYMVIKTVGRLHYEMVSPTPIPGEYNYKIPVGSISAAGFATLERSTGKLVSYINEGTDYRGGNNDSTLDNTNRTMLGKAATNQTTEYWRAAARKNGTGWLCTTMRHTSAISVLFGVIFGTHYDQDAVNSQKDANGLYQGGLGAGVTQMPDWGGYNGYRPVVPMSAGIELGDACGEASYEVKKDDGTVSIPPRYHPSSATKMASAYCGDTWMTSRCVATRTLP